MHVNVVVPLSGNVVGWQLPLMPPLQTSKYSRLIFHDLAPELDRLRQEGTSWIPHSVRIERSGRYGFLDEPFIQSIHFSELPCPERTATGERPPLDGNTSRAFVSFSVDQELVDCPLPVPEKAYTVFNSNENCGNTIVNGEMVIPDTGDFEPKCMVVVIMPDSRKALFEEFVAAGRIMTDKL